MGHGVESPTKVKVNDTQSSAFIHIPTYSAPGARYTSEFLQTEETLLTVFTLVSNMVSLTFTQSLQNLY